MGGPPKVGPKKSRVQGFRKEEVRNAYSPQPFNWLGPKVCRPRKGREMVKFASNFCYCAIDQEKAIFEGKRAVSGSSSALLGRPGTLNPKP